MGGVVWGIVTILVLRSLLGNKNYRGPSMLRAIMVQVATIPLAVASAAVLCWPGLAACTGSYRHSCARMWRLSPMPGCC